MPTELWFTNIDHKGSNR